MRYTDPAYNKIYGKGIRAPVQFESGKNGLSEVGLVDGIENIKQAIWIILTTRKGSRPMRPLLGTNIPMDVFDPNDIILRDDMSDDIKTSVESARSIIKITNIRFTEIDTVDSGDGNWVGIDIDFAIAGTNLTGNYVYPYHIESKGTF
jgi:uncharacterized protein